ncbi:MAG: DUF3179 domain-containing protein [Gammaproteobacteria bacterium]|nr:DUF3179 domain-containing protein [Gammaproteobacteria bacterium]MDH3448042.1 DUF3179 domain-containing protein [Gammaproteobacteria bacterium]
MRILISNRTRILALLTLLAGALSYGIAASAGASNGFDLSNSILPRDEILHGGPPRDGIPALSDPKLVEPAAADYLEPTDRVVGISLNGSARAYPIAILNWHEIVNDEINGRRFAITYCPLCGTAVAFDANIDGRPTDFGVSGLLYNSDVLLYDRDTESLWSQIMGESIAGERVGTRLAALPISHTTWRDWRGRYPDTLVLSDDTGYSRDYRRDPYAGYEASRSTYFSVNNEAPDDYHPKEVVIGLGVDGVYKAYPFVELDRQGLPRFSDSINGSLFTFDWDTVNRSVTITDGQGRTVAGIQGFWFAWFAFHPDTQVFKAEDL